MKYGVRFLRLARGLLSMWVMPVGRGANTPGQAKRWLFEPKFGPVVALSIREISEATGLGLGNVRARAYKLKDGEALRERDLPPPTSECTRRARDRAWTSTAFACAGMRLPFKRFGELVR